VPQAAAPDNLKDPETPLLSLSVSFVLNMLPVEIMKLRNKEIFELHAEYCRVMSNPKRLAIMACLDVKDMSVGEIAEVNGISLPAASRHLTALKNKHLVVSRKEGAKVFYSQADPRIAQACRMIRTVLIDNMKQRGEIAAELHADSVVVVE
jgi:ArsR family transcriptional regulator